MNDRARGNIDYRTLYNPANGRIKACGNIRGCSRVRVHRRKVGGYATRVVKHRQFSITFKLRYRASDRTRID